MRMNALWLGVLCAAAPLSAQEPLTVEAGPHRVLFAPASEAASGRAVAVLTAANAAVALKYGAALQGFRADVRLQLPPGAMHSRSGPYTCCIRDKDAGVTIATITQDNALSGVEEQVALATHLMPLAYLAVQTERGTGWLVNDAPEWFIEGLATLDGRVAILPAPKVRADLVRWKDQHLTTLECCGTSGRTLFVTDQAVGGAAFLAYVAEKVGADVHARVLRSQAPNFSQAFTEAVQPYTMDTLFEGFRVWR